MLLGIEWISRYSEVLLRFTWQSRQVDGGLDKADGRLDKAI